MSVISCAPNPYKDTESKDVSRNRAHHRWAPSLPLQPPWWEEMSHLLGPIICTSHYARSLRRPQRPIYRRFNIKRRCLLFCEENLREGNASAAASRPNVSMWVKRIYTACLITSANEMWTFLKGSDTHWRSYGGKGSLIFSCVCIFKAGTIGSVELNVSFQANEDTESKDVPQERNNREHYVRIYISAFMSNGFNIQALATAAAETKVERSLLMQFAAQ